MEPSSLKLYIAVREEVPAHMVPVCVAHAMCSASREMAKMDYYQKWLECSYKKVVVKVNAKEWEKLFGIDNSLFSFERHTLNGDHCVAVFCPRPEWPNVLKFAKMWKP